MQQFKPIAATLILIAVSVLVSLASSMGKNLMAIEPLFISEYVNAGLPEVSAGQWWRIVTPIFIHLGILHLVFNMLWLWELGGVLEVKHGKPRYLILIVLLAVASNLGQFIASGPAFGGMSGVVYGLLGFLWIRGKCDPFYGMQMRREIVIMMLAWFVLCLTGLLGNIGNASHGVGLVLGMVFGWLTSLKAVRNL